MNEVRYDMAYSLMQIGWKLNIEEKADQTKTYKNYYKIKIILRTL